MSFQSWRSHAFMGEPKQIPFAFGHDLREKKIWIVENATGRKIAELATDTLTPKELDLATRLIRCAPVWGNTLREAEARLWHAKHPNAVRLRQLIRDALRGLEEPITDDLSDRIDP